MKILAKRFDKSFPMPAYDSGAACFDLICRESATIEPGKIIGVPQNIALAVPTGYVLLMFIRSSTPQRRGLVLANSVGVIDPFYCGDNDENLAFFLNITDQPVHIEAGEKLVQGMIIKTQPIEWQEVEKMPADGHGGYSLEA